MTTRTGLKLTTSEKKMTVHLREIGAAKDQFTVELPLRFVRAMAFSPDGRRLVVADDLPGRQPFVIDLVTQRTTQVPFELPVRPQCLAFSPDGKRLATGFFDGTALIWDAGPRR